MTTSLHDPLEDQKRNIIKYLIDKNIFVDERMLSLFEDISFVQDCYKAFFDNNAECLNRIIPILATKGVNLELPEHMLNEQSNETKKDQEPEKLSEIKSPERNLYESSNKMGTLEVTFSYVDKLKKHTVQDFVGHFLARFHAIKKILQRRKELSNPTSIRRLSQKDEKEEVALIGLISEKRETKNGNIILTIEDNTDSINVIVTKKKNELFTQAKDLIYDEVVGITGTAVNKAVFVNEIFLPEIPTTKELKKSPDEVYAAFISDLHFGSKSFLHKEFDRFVSWIKGESGSDEQKRIASKVKYLFITGDLVEGVGYYPGQEDNLDEKDIYKQYKLFADFLRKLRKDIHIIISAGNHDAMRLAEPQPRIYKHLAPDLWEMPNVTLVSQPSSVNIHKQEGFPGFDVLIYHGFSFTYIADQVPSIRASGGKERADLIMKYLLRKRHLAPSHTSIQYIPDPTTDYHVIEKIPDIFISGHIHRVTATNFRNITLINSSSWLKMTAYQEKIGLIPQPGRAILLNLQTRKSKVLNFLTQENE